MSTESATAAIRTTRRFVECMANFLPANGDEPRAPDATPKGEDPMPAQAGVRNPSQEAVVVDRLFNHRYLMRAGR